MYLDTVKTANKRLFILTTIIYITDCCKDLPKYASCGLIKFQLTLFRETTYKLLLDNQRKEFHLRAARYIEKETRRCKSCEGGVFTDILREFGKVRH